MYKVIGFKGVDYESKKGFRVKGVELQCTYTDRRVDGVAVEKIYISDKVLSDSGYHLNDLVDATIRITYNRYGKPEFIQIIEG